MEGPTPTNEKNTSIGTHMKWTGTYAMDLCWAFIVPTIALLP